MRPKTIKTDEELLEESSKKVLKKMKEGNGKATFDGPKVKTRKKSAPPTQVHKKKKGAGSYSREKAEQIEENNTIYNLVDAILEKRYSDADKYLKDVVEKKLQRRIQEELTTKLFH